MANTNEHKVEKGEKRSSFALFEHLQFCERSMKRSALRYPWQLGFMADHDRLPLGMSPVLPASVANADCTDAVQLEQSSVFDAHCRKRYCKLPQVEWDVHLDSPRNAALAK